MNTDTSKKPVGNQFSLKALIQASFQKKKAIPVENQLKTSKQNGGEPVETSYPLTGLAVSVTGSGVNQYSRQGEKRDFGAETEKSNRANQARIDFPSLPEKEPLHLEEMTTEEIIAAVHEAFPDGPPLLYPTMPDWRKFCDAFPHCVRDDRKVCTFYQPDKACHCELFDKVFPGVGWWCVGESGQVPATSQGGRRGTEEEPRYYISLPEEKEPVGDAGEAEAMGWGTESGEASEVGALARAQFQSPPVDDRGFPDFPTFCAGYGKGCGKCRFFHQGRGPFCLVWAAAWPDFQREEKPASCDYPIMPDEKDAQAGRERLKADVAEVRARLRRPPLQYPDGPDWFAFCEGYPAGCDDCRYYARDKACWCRLWEACFPHVVHWYDWPE